jgi:hypothetical protein
MTTELDDATLNLQALSRLRDDHLEAKTAATNQLGALLDAHWPNAKAIFRSPRQPDRPGLPGALPDAPGGPTPGRGPAGPRSAGASPVTKQSGKAASVQFRWAASTRARDALATFVDNSRHASPGRPRSTGTPAGLASGILRPSGSLMRAWPKGGLRAGMFAEPR